MKGPTLTVGIEEEYQIIDPVTRDLSPGFDALVTSAFATEADVKAELHQCQVEIGTKPCATIAELRTELVKLRRLTIKAAGEHGLTIASAGTHPFSNWMNMEMTPKERYLGVKMELQDLAHRLLIFGTHVHVGIEDPEFRIDCLNAARYILPHILCLSTSSPFWFGRNTGLHSYRSIVFKNFPRTGVPRILNGWSDYADLVDTLVKTHSIPDGSKIWWDVRPHHLYPTLEFRCCDVNTKVDEAVCIAAMLQAVVAKMWKLRRDNMTFRVYAADLIEENKWRAVRYGMGGKLIDFGKKEELPTSVLIRELIEWFLDDVLDELGTRKEVEYAFKIMEEGSSAQRQLATYARTGDLRAVVDQLIRETAEGVCDPVLGPPLDSLDQAISAQPSTGPTPTGMPAVRGQSIP
ncbi:carboxylate-amine ligase [Gemmatimonas phototrophica]|uniref:Putative glutamate--cysteine ligase 2 n=1 Tax=Gemmatimonas phototrophica TaxID=1379270 RepID=A0A143BJF5_9BACT|nr:carboxylate-amine ligase [Gemmatimonas phototrophica]AMW04723.1 carboxylate--amine ligase [Gemmatimonas phototrophica]